MKREVIILSDLDLKLLEYIVEEKFIKDIFYEFDMNYVMINRHLSRLRKLNAIDESKFGTFKEVKTNETGLIIIDILKNART